MKFVKFNPAAAVAAVAITDSFIDELNRALNH